MISKRRHTQLDLDFSKLFLSSRGQKYLLRKTSRKETFVYANHIDIEKATTPARIIARIGRPCSHWTDGEARETAM